MEIRQNCHEISRAFDDRTGGDLQIDSHLPCRDVRQSRFTKPGRTIEEHVVKGLVPLFRRLNKNGKVLFDLFLPHIFTKAPGAQSDLVTVLVFEFRGADEGFFHNTMVPESKGLRIRVKKFEDVS